MKRNTVARLIAALLAATMLFALAACGQTGNDPEVPGSSAPASSAPVLAKKTVGEGATVFTFEAIAEDGTGTSYTVHTDEKTVGAALLGLGLIAGDQGAYGLYVKTVDGITADYDTDGSYWAFYIDGEYAMTGVDSTDITAGATYTLKVEKAS